MTWYPLGLSKNYASYVCINIKSIDLAAIAKYFRYSNFIPVILNDRSESDKLLDLSGVLD